MERATAAGMAVLLLAAGAAIADDKADVEAATESWGKAIAEGCAADPDRIASQYAKDGVLWGTLSPSLLSDTAAIRNYFVDLCARLPKLSVTFKDHLVRLHGDTAIDSGAYNFSFEKDGAKTDLPARYTFVLVRKGGRWQIVDHHSSAVPK